MVWLGWDGWVGDVDGVAGYDTKRTVSDSP